MSKKKSQGEMIIDYINEFGSITQMDAIYNIGCTRLPSRICELKKAGYNIITEMVSIKNRWGDNVKIAKYRFAEEDERNAG